MEIDRPLRGARATVFAVACVGVSAAGHVWMSGAAVPAWALLAALLAVGGAGYALAGRQRGFASIAGLMLAGELGLHLLFTAAQHAGVAASSSMSGMPGMPPMPGMIVSHPVPAAAWLCGGGKTGLGGPGSQTVSSSMASMSAHGAVGMIAVHVAAGLLCAWWLRRGEIAVFRLLRVLARFAAPLLVIVWPGARMVLDFSFSVPNHRGERAPTYRRLLVDAVVRRGPPPPLFCM